MAQVNHGAPDRGMTALPIRLNRACPVAMNEETGKAAPHGSGGYLRFIDWLNHKLVGPLGPPPLGPYDEVVERVAAASCPVCDRPMSEHTIDHSQHNAVLHCPIGHERSGVRHERLNELGMPKRGG